MARLGQFSLINPAERAVVLAARTRSVRDQLAHLATMRDLATGADERWGALVTRELIRRHEQELAWLAELTELAATPEPESHAEPEPGAGPDAEPGAATT